MIMFSKMILWGDNMDDKTFISMMEVLGYDIELTYVKRKPD